MGWTMTGIYVVFDAQDDEALTAEEAEALVDPDIFPCSCETCRHDPAGWQSPSGACCYCFVCGSHAGWEPREHGHADNSAPVRSCQTCALRGGRRGFFDALFGDDRHGICRHPHPKCIECSKDDSMRHWTPLD